MSARPEELLYAVNEKPPLRQLILLGLQHATLMSVYLVIIVILVRAANVPITMAHNAISMGMIALAISTALQAIWKGPVGSGYLAAPVISAIYLEPSLQAAHQGGLALVFGMTIFAGVVEIIMSQLLYRLRVLFPAGISGFIITIVGIQLGVIGIGQVLGVETRSDPHYFQYVLTAIITLITMVSLSIWVPGVMRLMCSFLGIVVGYIISIFLGLVPSDALLNFHHAALFAIPNLSYISYHFQSSLIIPFLIASVAASLRTVGVITSCQKINNANWKRPDLKNIKGGVLADGLGCLMGGVLGVPGMNTGPSLVGVSKASGATSRYIAFSAAIILIVLAFFPKIITLFLIMPVSVIGAALVFTSSFMIVGGIQVMLSRNIDTRMTYVIGIALLLGISHDAFPDFFNHLAPALQLFTSTALSLSIIAALVLNLIFRIGIRRKATMVVEQQASTVSIAQLSDFIHQSGKAWEVSAEIQERSISTTIEVLHHLRQMNLAQGPIRTSLSYDQVDFIVTIQYKGDLLSLPFVGQRKSIFLEEESFSYGLADFLTGVYPDRFERSIVHNQAEIRLYFAV